MIQLNVPRPPMTTSRSMRSLTTPSTLLVSVAMTGEAAATSICSVTAPISISTSMRTFWFGSR